MRNRGFEDDLRAVLSHLISSYGAMNAVEKLVRSVDEAQRILAEQPYIHAISDKSGWSEKLYREHYVQNYVIVYRIDEQTVTFLRFLHQAQLLERLVIDGE